MEPDTTRMDPDQLRTLASAIFDSFAEGRHRDLEGHFAELMRADQADILSFVYGLMMLSVEAAGARPAGLVSVPHLERLDGSGWHELDIEDVPLASSIHARLYAAAANNDEAMALALWNSLPQLQGGMQAIPTIVSYALQEAYLQTVIRPMHARFN